MKAQAKDSINQQLIDMEVGAAADQAQMARDFGRDAAAGIQGGIAAAGQAAQQAASLVPLFSASKADRAASSLDEAFGTGDELGKTTGEGGTGMTTQQRLNKLSGYNFTPREIRQLTKGGSIDVDAFKQFVTGTDDRFKNLQQDIGSVTDLAGLQKLLYGY